MAAESKNESMASKPWTGLFLTSGLDDFPAHRADDFVVRIFKFRAVIELFGEVRVVFEPLNGFIARKAIDDVLDSRGDHPRSPFPGLTGISQFKGPLGEAIELRIKQPVDTLGGVPAVK